MVEEKGATEFDKLCHKVFAANCKDYFAKGTGMSCSHCGQELTVTYCESRLYAVKCNQCKTVALAMAGSPIEAAHKTLLLSQPNALSKNPIARPLEEWSEDIGPVLWWKFPVEEPPYVGSPLDADWPSYHTHWTPISVPNAENKNYAVTCLFVEGAERARVRQCSHHGVKVNSASVFCSLKDAIAFVKVDAQNIFDEEHRRNNRPSIHFVNGEATVSSCEGNLIWVWKIVRVLEQGESVCDDIITLLTKAGLGEYICNSYDEARFNGRRKNIVYAYGNISLTFKLNGVFGELASWDESEFDMDKVLHEKIVLYALDIYNLKDEEIVNKLEDNSLPYKFTPIQYRKPYGFSNVAADDLPY